jgi:TetR/AcrR family transcriptional regulator
VTRRSDRRQGLVRGGGEEAVTHDRRTTERRTTLVERREEVREAILSAAITEFAENGLRGASTQRIADRAALSKTRLHYYISSKDELYREALEHVAASWVRLFEGTAADTSDPVSFLTSYIDRKVRFCLDRPDEVRLFANEVLRGAPILRHAWAGARPSMLAAAEMIEAWADAGLIRRVDPVLFQFHLWAVTEHYATRMSEVRYMLDVGDAEAIDVDHIVREMTDFVLGGIGADIGRRPRPPHSRCDREAR